MPQISTRAEAISQKTVRSKKKRKMRRGLPLLIMTIPAIIYLIINNYLPMVGLIVAFKDVNFSQGLLRSDWVGFDNFIYLFKTHDAWVITRNTILYNAVFIVLTNGLAITIAILFNEIRLKFIKKFYQTIMLAPYLISAVIVGFLVFAFLSMENGFMNKTILPLLGLDPISWYIQAKYWPFILTIVQCWKEVGYLSLIYLAAIVGIDPQLFEAAKIDGANKLKQILNITIPSIIPVISIMFILAVGKIFYSDFGLFYQVPLNSGPLFSTTNTIDTYVFRALMVNNDVGRSAAAGLYQSIVGFLLVMITNYIVSKRNPENALF